MLIEFDKLPEEIKTSFRGGTGAINLRMNQAEGFRFMLGRLEPNSSIGLHTHENDCEVCYFLSGQGKMHYQKTTQELRPGTCHFCPPGHSHSMVNDGNEDLVFFAAVIPGVQGL